MTTTTLTDLTPIDILAVLRARHNSYQHGRDGITWEQVTEAADAYIAKLRAAKKAGRLRGSVPSRAYILRALT